MILKSNVIYDIYEGEYPVKIDQMTNPKPLAVIARASWQGLGTRNRAADTRAIEYANQCKAAGIKYGLYHFLTPNGIAEQAALFMSVWDACKGADIVPIVDVEVDLVRYYPAKDASGRVIAGATSIGHQVWQGHVKTFLDAIALKTGKTPMIYTNKNYWSFVMTKDSVTGAMVPPTWTADYPLWVAQYPDQPDGQSVPSVLPNGWTKYAIWQYNDKGRSNGFLANDLNTTSDWYAAELGGVVIPPPPPVDPPITGAPDRLEVIADGVSTWYRKE
jgi:GH25 family lysozyme M1 (1,4-beta-N-acetylmuramidase)